jgi:hypothetical protein
LCDNYDSKPELSHSRNLNLLYDVNMSLQSIGKGVELLCPMFDLPPSPPAQYIFVIQKSVNTVETVSEASLRKTGCAVP